MYDDPKQGFSIYVLEFMSKRKIPSVIDALTEIIDNKTFDFICYSNIKSYLNKQVYSMLLNEFKRSSMIKKEFIDDNNIEI